MLIALLAVDACVFEAQKLYYPSQVVACLETIELERNVFSATQDFLEYYMAQYVQEEYYSQGALDLQKYLAQLRTDYYKLDKPMHQYFNAVQAVFASFKDAHLQFKRPSLYSVFEYVSPLTFTLENGTWIARENTNVSSLYLYDSRFAGLKDVFGKVVLHLNGYMPENYFVEFGANHTSILNDTGAVANHVLFTGFAQSDLRKEPLLDDNITMSVGGAPTVNFSRMVIPTRNISSNADFRIIYESSFIANPYVLSETVDSQYKHDETNQIAASDKLIAKYDNFFALYRQDKDFLLQFLSFTPADLRAGLYTLIGGLETVRKEKKDASRMFVTIFGNYQGDISVASRVIELLVRVARPLEPKMKLKYSQTVELLSRTHNGYFPLRYFDVLTYKELYSKNNTEYLFAKSINITSYKSRYFLYSTYFSADSFTDLELDYQISDFSPLNFDPNKLIIVTNGDCVSAAGFFAYVLREHNMALAVNLGFDNKQFCGSSGGFSNSVNDYYAAVKEILADANKSAEYNRSATDVLKQYLPMDMDIAMNLMSLDGSGFSLNHDASFDRLEVVFDVKFDKILVYEQTAFTDQILTDLHDVFAYDYSHFGYGKTCKHDSAAEGEIFREFHVNDTDTECRKWACDSAYQQYTYGNTFACVVITETHEKTKNTWGGKDTAITVLSCVIAAFCALIGVWVYFQIKKCAGSGPSKSKGAVYATDDQIYT